jgi:putative transposase
VFHVLNRAAARQTLFHTEGDYDAFLRILEEARRKVPMRLLAFSVMPTHWHLVLWPENDDALSEYMRWLTMTHAQRWHAAHGTTGTGGLYQGRFKSFPVQEDGHFLTLCRYVERNPLRANLVRRAELWKWSSLWTGCSEAVMVSLSPWPVPRPTDWIAHVNSVQTDAELSAIRKSIVRSCPYGEAEWSRNAAKSLGIEHTLRIAGRQGY